MLMKESRQITIAQRHEEARKALWNYLANSLRDCDGTLKQTKAYLKAYGLSEDEVTDMLYLLPYYGGYCDCEVVFNVEDPFPVGKTVRADYRGK